MATRLLEPQHYQVVGAESGAEALGALRKTRPDVILMDLEMPGIGGIETLRHLKAAPQFSGISVVMITGKSEGDAVVACMKAGACDFIVKPFDRDTLLTKVARAISAKAAS